MNEVFMHCRSCNGQWSGDQDICPFCQSIEIQEIDEQNEPEEFSAGDLEPCDIFGHDWKDVGLNLYQCRRCGDVQF